MIHIQIHSTRLCDSIMPYRMMLLSSILLTSNITKIMPTNFSKYLFICLSLYILHISFHSNFSLSLTWFFNLQFSRCSKYHFISMKIFSQTLSHKAVIFFLLLFCFFPCAFNEKFPGRFLFVVLT